MCRNAIIGHVTSALYGFVRYTKKRTAHSARYELAFSVHQLINKASLKEPQVSVIFTVSPDATFSSFAPDSIPYKDSKLAIFFETQEMMEDTLILLRFNCPDPDCDFIGSGWSDIKLHVRGVHGKLMWYVYSFIS